MHAITRHGVAGAAVIRGAPWAVTSRRGDTASNNSGLSMRGGVRQKRGSRVVRSPRAHPHASHKLTSDPSPLVPFTLAARGMER